MSVVDVPPKILEATNSNIPPAINPEEADEREWALQFAASGDFLMQLVAEAREERRQGLLLPLDTVLDE